MLNITSIRHYSSQDAPLDPILCKAHIRPKFYLSRTPCPHSAQDAPLASIMRKTQISSFVCNLGTKLYVTFPEPIFGHQGIFRVYM